MLEKLVRGQSHADSAAADLRTKAEVAETVSTHDSLARPVDDFVDEASLWQTEAEEHRPGATTLMVRNIPEPCTNEMLLEAWPVDGTWDFLYVPMTAGGKSALGYAFINFISEEHASAFAARWQGARLPHFVTGRRMKVKMADVQGFEANVDVVRRKPAGRMRSRRCSPIIVRDGYQAMRLFEA